MHRLALVVALVVLLPTVAAAQPSAVDVEATLVHDRDMLTKAMTEVCACDTLACAKDPLATFDLWTTEHIVMQGRRGFEKYNERVAKDEVIKNLRDELLDCHALLRAKPLAKGCTKRLAAAAKTFARRAPKVFPIYKTLDFGDHAEPNDEPMSAIASVHITPGRSWEFRAVIGAPSVAESLDIEPADVGGEWSIVGTELGVAQTRRFGGIVAVFTIRSERWGDGVEPATHPLTELFFDTMRAAVTACVQPRR